MFSRIQRMTEEEYLQKIKELEEELAFVKADFNTVYSHATSLARKLREERERYKKLKLSILYPEKEKRI